MPDDDERQSDAHLDGLSTPPAEILDHVNISNNADTDSDVDNNAYSTALLDQSSEFFSDLSDNDQQLINPSSDFVSSDCLSTPPAETFADESS
eukprot:CAMPEP_0201553878 /NCGR_PEP_ID=MMETSP0173_2-20130828/35029_1 /ASSEMBLY_ACC=CAM_ASM_000268 /TAXON_ID=218659 /ORGANISM="Vexillifera sp., Strain DIVA3 564/2" /LENGTH=92 /DNA_ID=CAMNT_0047964911 /DNA_START=34 /DNA_END=309 /DNA_ORIENTATION=-